MTLRSALTKPIHPALASHSARRSASLQNRIADGITTFAGSMAFVYIHIVWFIIWVITQPFGDKFPFGLLTMIVSLEAIFLSTFVMISQNRADQRRQVLADHQWQLVQDEKKQNEQLLTFSHQLLEITREVHTLTAAMHSALCSAPGSKLEPFTPTADVTSAPE